MNQISSDKQLKQLFISTGNYTSTTYDLDNEYPSANDFYEGK